MKTTASARSFPRTCVKCRRKAVEATTVDRVREVKYDGAMYTLDLKGLPAEQCGNCGLTTFGDEADQFIDRALREHIGLLTPEQILTARAALKLTQEALAKAIGCAAESVSRWEGGVVIQSRAYDRWLRAYFDVPAVRQYFAILDGAPFVSTTRTCPIMTASWTLGWLSSATSANEWSSTGFPTGEPREWCQSPPFRDPREFRDSLAA